MNSPKPSSEAEKIVLERLRAAGGPLSKTRLAGNRRLEQEAFAALVKRGAILNLGSASRTAYMEVSDSKAALLERMAAEVVKIHLPDAQISPVSLTQLTKRTPFPLVRKALVSLLQKMLEQKEIISVQFGVSRLLLHAAPLRDHLGLARPASAEAAPPASEVDETVRRAYGRVVERTQFGDVYIEELHREAGLPLPTLHGWLLRELRAHKIVASPGEPTLATEEQRRTALRDGNETLYLMRIL